SQDDVLPQHDLAVVHRAGHGHPVGAGVPVGRLLVGHLADDGGNNKDVTLLGGDVAVLSEVCLNDGAVGGLQVGLGALVESAAAHAGQSFGQCLLSDVIVQADGGIVQQLHGAVDFGVDVVVVGAGVFNQVEDVLLCRSSL